MSFGASLLRTVYQCSGVKKAFALPEDRLLKAIEKANRGRGFFLPADHKAYYEKKMIGGFPCLVVRAEEKPEKRAILFFFGGGMVIGPDKGDAAVLRKLCFGAGCDVWFPIYPLCTEHCITESYDMAFECYRQMITQYGSGNVSTCGFSSGGALPEFERACVRANVPYTVTAQKGMVHCYCMLPYYKEAKEDFAKIVEILKKEETIR